MERYCSTGQSPQWAVAPTEEEYTFIQRRKYSKMDKGATDKLAGSPGENGGG